MFPNNMNGKTILSKTNGKVTPTRIIGRRFEVNQCDLTGSYDNAHRKFLFKVKEVRGYEAVGKFDGMVLTTDKQKSIVKKWHTLIEAVYDITSKEGNIIRVFTMAVTKKTPTHTKKTCYAKTSEIQKIRKIMFNVIAEELEGVDEVKIMKKLCNETIGKEIEKLGSEIFPLQDCCVRKVKVVKTAAEIGHFSGAVQNEMVEVEN